MFFDKKNKNGEYIFDILLNKSDKKNYIYTLAEAHAIDLIAKTIAKSEIQVFLKSKDNKKIKKIKNEVYWRLNIQPNYIENGTMFLYKLVTKILSDKEALVIINKEKDGSKLLYVADEFRGSNNILYGKTFSDIVLSDNNGNTIDLDKKYSTEDTIYYSLKNSKLSSAKTNFKNDSSKILNAISKAFIQSNVPKWRLKNPGGQPTMIDWETNKPISYDNYKKKVTEGLFNDEESVVMLSEVFDLINLNKDNDKSLSDYKDVIKNIGDMVASSWNIPLDVFWGSKTEKSTGNNDFITFAVSPYFELLEDGFNISLVGKKDYLNGEYVKFNRTNLNHRDIIDSANGIDKLTADGFSRNEINDIIGMPYIDEEWANEHNLTKNYANVKGGGQENGE